jgi:hypothetical protein
MLVLTYQNSQEHKRKKMEIQNKYLAIQSIKKSKGIVLLILTSIFFIDIIMNLAL